MHSCSECNKLCLRAVGVSWGKWGHEYLGFIFLFLFYAVSLKRMHVLVNLQCFF